LRQRILIFYLGDRPLDEVPVRGEGPRAWHSDVNPTVKRHGRFAAEAKEQFAWINALAQPVEALAEARKLRPEVAR